MFIALNSCPSFHEKLYWKVIYGSVSRKSRMAKLASNVIRNSKDDFKVKAIKIFANISSALGFQHISYHREENKSIGLNLDLRKNTLDVKGEKKNSDNS